MGVNRFEVVQEAAAKQAEMLWSRAESAQPSNDYLVAKSLAPFGIRQSRGLASAELMQLYVPFYCERRDGKPWEEIEDDLESDPHVPTAEIVPAQVKALLEPFIVRGDGDDG